MMYGDEGEQNGIGRNSPPMDEDNDDPRSVSPVSSISADRRIPKDFDRITCVPGTFVVSVKGIGGGTNANINNEIRRVIIPPFGPNGGGGEGPEKVQQMVDYVKKRMKVEENDYGEIIVKCSVEDIKGLAEIGMEMAMDRRAKYEITFGKKQLKQQQMGAEALIIGTVVFGIIAIGLFNIPNFGFKFGGQQKEMKGAETKEMMDWKRLAEEMKIKVWELEETLNQRKGKENQLNAELDEAQKEVKRMKAANEIPLDKSADLVRDESDMSMEMQEVAKECVRESMDKSNNEWDMAKYIKEYFDKKYGPYWHCIVGRFNASFLYDRAYIKFSLGKKSILLYKSKQ